MKTPLWKKYLSYLWEIPLESRSSEYNPELHVSLIDGQYQLFTEHAIYSFGEFYYNFRTAFEQLDLANRNIENVLVLGLGLGSIPLILEKKFNRQYHYTAIEIDEEVIDLAEKYVLNDLKSPRQLICGDAHTFAATSNEKYDLITVDIFLDHIVPVRFETIEFLENLQNLLQPDGLLMINRMADTPHTLQQTTSFYQHRFLQVFPNGRYLEIENNRMLLNQ